MSTEKNRISRLKDRISELKNRRDALILAHNYQLGEVQDIADVVGDSLELSRIAAASEASVVVFCGVHFMAETAYILSPDKTVLLPNLGAGCPMADMITAAEVKRMRQDHPNAMVVAYVNTSAEVKAHSDVCCTSANAARLVANLDAEEIIFVPDQYLGSYVMAQTGKTMILSSGYCPTHARISGVHIAKLRKEYPEAVVIAHPECRPDAIELADEVLSTGGMCQYVKTAPARQIIVATEIGIIHRLQKENPNKVYLPVSEQAVCPNMKMITLDDIVRSLEDMAPEVTVPEDIRARAKLAVDRMLLG